MFVRAARRALFVSGGGLVAVTTNGKGDVRSVRIDPSLMKPEEVEILEDLIVAAYERHMHALTEATEAQASQAGSAEDRLRNFIVASLTPPVVDARAMALWAGFIHMVRRDQAMQDTHERTYYHFRDRLEVLIAAARREAGCAATPATNRRHAIACNAVIDGLWLEGGALPEAFADSELAEIGLTSVAAITGLEFHERKGAP